MDEFNIKASLLKNSDIEGIVSQIHEYGCVRFPDFIATEKLQQLLVAFEYGLKYDNYAYGYGKMARFEKLTSDLHLVEKFFDAPFFHGIIKGYWESFSEIKYEYSFVHDYKYDQNTIYGHLHYDRRHQLKFMLYLTDVESQNHGAFCAIPKSNVLGRKLYAESWKKALALETNDVLEIEKIARLVPDSDARYKSLTFRIVEDNLSLEEFKFEKVVPLIGSAGTLIIFDTNIIHLGGLVKENLERKSLRLQTFPL